MNDITIRKLSIEDKAVVTRIVDIHLATFKGFFLTFMGRGFLKQMYKAYLKHSLSGIYVAEADNEVIGFLSYSEHMSGLYKYMIKHQLIPFAWYSLGAFIRKPKVFLRLIRAFLKPNESSRNEQYIELSSIGVHPDSKANGVGSKLVETLKKDVNFEVFEYITLETDAENNDVAINFYVKNGFVVEKEYETREGRKMLEFHFRPNITFKR